MSYILEALRKSEQERNADKVPDLSTSHTHIQKQRKTNYFWWIVGIVIMLSNGLYLVYLVSEKPQIMESSPKVVMEPNQHTGINKEVKNNIAIDETRVNDVISPPQVTSEPKPFAELVQETEKAIENEPIVETRVDNKIDFLDRAALSDITELPYTIQQQLPDMVYSTHIHVKDGGSFIIINGKSLSEGMYIDRDLSIIKILSDGIVLDYNGRRFFMASMTNWGQN